MKFFLVKYSINTLVKQEPIIPVLIGVTATGKTELLEQLEQKTLIINADSRQVYKKMDIGTAKPDKALLARHPHVGINVVSPDTRFDVGSFVELVLDAINSSELPCVIAGGSGFYIRHLLYGLPHTEEVDPAIREQIVCYLQEVGSHAAHVRLSEIDSVSACKIHKNDTYRISRALEIYEQTGIPRSEYPIMSNPAGVFPHEIVGLRCSQDILVDRIKTRVEAMFQAGLVDELADLRHEGYSLKDHAMRCIGYKEFFVEKEWCNGSHSSSLFDTIKNNIIVHTIKYAKRQRVFFKQFSNAKWFDIQDSEKLLSYIKAMMN